VSIIVTPDIIANTPSIIHIVLVDVHKETHLLLKKSSSINLATHKHTIPIKTGIKPSHLVFSIIFKDNKTLLGAGLCPVPTRYLTTSIY